MKKTKIFITTIVTIVLLSSFATVYCLLKRSSKTCIETEQYTTKTTLYEHRTNGEVDFSFEYPSIYNQIEETDKKIVFRIKDDPGMSGFAVNIENTDFNTIDDWYKNQQKGDSTTPGYQGVSKINDNALLVTKYTAVDRDGDKPIYGQIQSVVMIINGKKFEFIYPNQFMTTEIPVVNVEILDMVNSFGYVID